MRELAPRRPFNSQALSPRRPLIALAGLLLAGTLGVGWAALAEGQSIADVSRVFGTWDEWEGAYGDLVVALDAFEGLAEEPIETAETLVAVLEARDRVYQTARGVEGYLYLRLQLDGGDEEARSREYLIDETDRRWNTVGSPWFTRSLSELGRERIKRWMVAEQALRRYDFFLHRFFDRVGHPYPEGQGELRVLSGIAGRQSDRVYKALAISEGPVVEVTIESGERLELNPGRARSILEELPSALDRASVSRAWLEVLGRQSQTYAALLEGIVERQKLLAEVRGFDSALSAQLDGDAITADAVRNAVRVARETSTPLRRYHSLRKKVLAIDTYGLADRFVSLDEGERKIGFDEARRIVVESSSTLGPEVQELVRRAFSEGWIDSVERPGKRAHGGSTFVAGHPYVLVNYRGSLESLFQLAHEIGHAVHAHLAYNAQPFVYGHRSSLTSEAVASIFEGVLVEHMVERATSAEETIGVIDLSIQNLLRIFHRPMLDADFEIRVYEVIESITGPSLAELYLTVVKDFYGDAVTLTDWDGHGWQRTPHYYTSPLYLGRYGLATAAANVLIPRLTSADGSARTLARQGLLDLMRAGASRYPLELLRRAGADLENPHTFEALATRLESLVDELERALDGD